MGAKGEGMRVTARWGSPARRLLAGGMLSLLAAGAAAETRALLVGAGDYLYIDADLKGPANDVARMARAFAARGVADVVRLVDDGEGVDGPATRAAILAALADLAAATGPGDTAVFYFSGHGSQAPDISGDEQGGEDEIFLPVDVRGWDGRARAVENAILDDEMRDAFAAILAKGGKVVAILDACHSATGFRAVSGGQVRAVSRSLLGVPDGLDEAGTGGDTGGLEGEYVFLYSSRDDEQSFEYPFGDAADPANWYSAFSAALGGVLEQGGALSWAQAVDAATASMKAAHPRATQTPDAEGTALASRIDGAAGVTRFRVLDGEVQAGRLDGLLPGTLLRIVDLATGTDEIATAEIASADATRARLAGGAPAEGWAEVIRPGPPEPFRLAPLQVVSGDPAPVLAALAALDLPGVVLDADRPDAVPVLVEGQLLLTGPDGAVDRDGPGSTPRAGGDIAGFIDRAARTHRLRAALAAAGGGGGFRLPGSALKVTSEIERAAGGCAEHAAPEALPQPPDVGNCDRIWLTLKNPSKDSRDVTVLYIDRDLGVQVLWPEPGTSNRLGTGEEVEVGLEIRLDGPAAGREEIVILAVKAEPGRPRTVLTGLADPAAERGGGDLERWLYAAADPEASARAFTLSKALPALDVKRIGLRLRP